MPKVNKKTKEEPIKEITPEQALQDFITRTQSENRHTRRMMGKIAGIKINGTQVPYRKNENK